MDVRACYDLWTIGDMTEEGIGCMFGIGQWRLTVTIYFDRPAADEALMHCAIARWNGIARKWTMRNQKVLNLYFRAGDNTVATEFPTIEEDYNYFIAQDESPPSPKRRLIEPHEVVVLSDDELRSNPDSDEDYVPGKISPGNKTLKRAAPPKSQMPHVKREKSTPSEPLPSNTRPSAARSTSKLATQASTAPAATSSASGRVKNTKENQRPVKNTKKVQQPKTRSGPSPDIGGEGSSRQHQRPVPASSRPKRTIRKRKLD
jgi:hypothetical protein